MPTSQSPDARPRQIRGRLRLEVRAADGAVVARRRSSNTVVRSGGELLADLFSGALTTPVNAMAVGVDSVASTTPYELAGLTTATAGGTPLLVASVVPLAPDAFATETLAEQLLVRIVVRGVVPAEGAVSPDADVATVDIGEAALGVLADDGQALARVYNRVVFEPVPKGRDQEIALYWEIDFPYGP